MNGLCRATGVSRAGYYRFLVGAQLQEIAVDLRSQIQRIALRWAPYGYRRVHAELRRHGWTVNHKRILRLMRADNLLCLRRRKFILTTDSKHSLPVYPNTLPYNDFRLAQEPVETITPPHPPLPSFETPDGLHANQYAVKLLEEIRQTGCIPEEQQWTTS